jgi:hypothetical protein
MGAHEAARTPLAWPMFSLTGASSAIDLLQRQENTEAWLYYTFWAIPLSAMVVAVVRRVRRGPAVERETAALVALCVLTLVAERFLLRSNLEARLGDVAPPVAVLGAVLLGASTSLRLSHSREELKTEAGLQTPVYGWYFLRAALGMAITIVTIASIWALGSVPSNLRTGKLLEGPGTVVERASRISQELVALPAALRVSGPRDRMEASDYVHQCTRSSDRVLVVGYAPEVPVFAERQFAGGRAMFFWGFYRDEQYSRDTLSRLQAESVPIVLADVETQYDRLPLIAEYLRSHYTEAGHVMTLGRPLRVLVPRGATGRPFGPAGLPCFT